MLPGLAAAGADARRSSDQVLLVRTSPPPALASVKDRREDNGKLSLSRKEDVFVDEARERSRRSLRRCAFG